MLNIADGNVPSAMLPSRIHQFPLARYTFDGYQDTLYVHANRQFYRDCDIYGTIDFIFGNSAVILQNCNIFPRLPMKGQKDTITAQGRIDPNQNTGISIHECNVSPSGDLSYVRVYLGRPWKNYSTTVFMKSSLAGVVNSKGWLPWAGDTAPETIFYGEFGNFGAGAPTKDRVWGQGGLRRMDEKKAMKFTVGGGFFGRAWMDSKGWSAF